MVLRADAPDDAERKVKVPVGEYHRFENEDSNKALASRFRLDEQDYETEDSLFKTFFGYIDDCRRAKTEPSVFQLFLLVHAVGASLAVPVSGPRWARVLVNRAVKYNVLMGLVFGS